MKICQICIYTFYIFIRSSCMLCTSRWFEALMFASRSTVDVFMCGAFFVRNFWPASNINAHHQMYCNTADGSFTIFPMYLINKRLCSWTNDDGILKILSKYFSIHSIDECCFLWSFAFSLQCFCWPDVALVVHWAAWIWFNKFCITVHFDFCASNLHYCIKREMWLHIIRLSDAFAGKQKSAF